jgi:hypothetical protein
MHHMSNHSLIPGGPNGGGGGSQSMAIGGGHQDPCL